MTTPTTEEPADGAEPAAPMLRVIRGGDPTDEELAALVAVLGTAGAPAPPPPDPARRTPLRPWVASGLVKGTRTRV